MSGCRLSVWPPLSPVTVLEAPVAPLPYPLCRSDVRLFSRARHGLFHGVAALGLQPGDVVLVPAYHHGSEVEVLCRAGLRCRFYDVGPDLGPCREQLDVLVDERVRALYLIHPLGLPLDASGWRAWCDRRGLLLIEDAAQSWLSEHDGRPVGSWSDLAIFCLYKMVGAPDGAACVSRARLPRLDVAVPIGVAGAARRVGSWAAHRWTPRAGASSGPVRYDPDADFALADPWSAASRIAQHVARRTSAAAVSHARRENARLLLSELGQYVPPSMRPRPGSSPLVLPVAVDDKPPVLKRLAARGVHALDVWSVPHPVLPVGQHPAAARLRQTVLGLPVHHELRTSDLERVVEAFRASAPVAAR